MSLRLIRYPFTLPTGVSATIKDNILVISQQEKTLTHHLHYLVDCICEQDQITIAPKDATLQDSLMQAGTAGALVRNMIHGVSQGYVKSLQLVGVGYKAELTGNKLQLALGFSHPVFYEPPQGVLVSLTSPTVIKLSSSDKQLLGECAAIIRSFRPPEPYKGKGVRYLDEQVKIKEIKRKR